MTNMDNHARDVRFAAALSRYSDDMSRAELNALRRSAGTLAPISRLLGEGSSRLSRFMWRLFNVEYL